jgi:hypothetical protein
LEERKARVQEMKEMREKRRVVLDKPMNPLSDISSVVKRRTVSIAVPTAPATVSVQVQANSSRQQNLERVRARCAALREENQVREEAEKKKRDEEEVRAAFKKLAEEKMKVVTPDEIRITSISRQRDVKPVKGCLKQVKANPYGTVSLDWGCDSVGVSRFGLGWLIDVRVLYVSLVIDRQWIALCCEYMVRACTTVIGTDRDCRICFPFSADRPRPLSLSLARHHLDLVRAMTITIALSDGFHHPLRTWTTT